MIDSSPPKRKRPRPKSAPEVTVDVNVYDIHCQCGEKITGPRAADTRLLPCPACERLHYVLPTNPYPEPRKIKPKKKRKAGKPAASVLAMVKGGLSVATKAIGSRAGKAATGAKNKAVSTATWTRRQITPLRVISASILLVLALTLWYGVSTRNYSQAQVLFSDAWANAQEKLQARDMNAADEQLQLAVKALNTLRPGDALEHQVRQLGRELFTLNHLSSYDMFDIATDAQSYASNHTLGLWPTRFTTLYQGSWMIFDLRIKQAENGKGAGPHFEFGQDLVIESTPIVIQAALPCLKNLEVGETHERVIIAAQLDDWKFENAGGDHWVISLKPETAFLWCHPETLSMVASARQPWDSEDELRKLFERQSKASHVEQATSLLTAQAKN